MHSICSIGSGMILDAQCQSNPRGNPGGYPMPACTQSSNSRGEGIPWEIPGEKSRGRGRNPRGNSRGNLRELSSHYTGMHTLNQIPRGIPGGNHTGPSFSLYQHEHSQANSGAGWEKSQGVYPYLYTSMHTVKQILGEKYCGGIRGDIISL